MTTKGWQVLQMLIPNGGWVMEGDSFEGIQFIECAAITEAQFEQGKIDYEQLKLATKAKAATDKAALLAKLGMNEDDLKTLLS